VLTIDGTVSTIIYVSYMGVYIQYNAEAVQKLKQGIFIIYSYNII